MAAPPPVRPGHGADTASELFSFPGVEAPEPDLLARMARLAAEGGQLPGKEALRMANLVARYAELAHEGRVSAQSERQRRQRLEELAPLVEVALRSADIAIIQATFVRVAVERFANAFAGFVEKAKDGATFQLCHSGWRGRDTATEAWLSPGARERLAEIVTARRPVRFSAAEPRPSVLGVAGHRCALAVPIFTGRVLRHLFLVEDDRKEAFEESEFQVFRNMCSQLALVWSRLLYKKSLEGVTAELEEAHRRLAEANERSRELSDALRKELAPEEARSLLEASGAASRSTVGDRPVLVVGLAGFAEAADSSRPEQVIDLLNSAVAHVASIVVQRRGEMLRHDGGEIRALFSERSDALAAADDLLKSQARLDARLSARGAPPVRLKAGLAFGKAVQGMVGPLYQRERTLLGEGVDTAARLCANAEPGTALVDMRVVPEGSSPEALGLASVSSLVLKGREKPLPVAVFARDRAAYEPEWAVSDAPPAGPFGDEEILVIDDDPEMLRLLSVCLGAAGYRVRTAPGGAEALAAMESARPAMVLCDVHMPGMSGFELCRKVRSLGHTDIPFVFCSALTGLPQRVAGLRVGADDYILKPVHPDELVARVRRQLERGRALTELKRQAARPESGEVLRGSLEEVEVPLILQTVESLHSPGVKLHLERHDGAEGSIYISRTEVVHAETGPFTGEKAFLRMLGWRSGSFSAEPLVWAGEPTLSAAVPELLLGGLAQVDEQRLLRRALGGSLAIAPGVDLFTQRFDLETLSVLDLLSEKRSLDELLDASPSSDLSTMRILTALIQAGVVVHD